MLGFTSDWICYWLIIGLTARKERGGQCWGGGLLPWGQGASSASSSTANILVLTRERLLPLQALRVQESQGHPLDDPI